MSRGLGAHRGAKRGACRVLPAETPGRCPPAGPGPLSTGDGGAVLTRVVGRPALPEATAVRVVVLGQQLPQGPVDDDQGHGELARLLGVPLLPRERGRPLGAGPWAGSLRGRPPAGRPHRGTLCNVSRRRSWTPVSPPIPRHVGRSRPRQRRLKRSNTAPRGPANPLWARALKNGGQSSRETGPRVHSGRSGGQPGVTNRQTDEWRGVHAAERHSAPGGRPDAREDTENPEPVTFGEKSQSRHVISSTRLPGWWHP